jgi:hypothetical protein
MERTRHDRHALDRSSLLDRIVMRALGSLGGENGRLPRGVPELDDVPLTRGGDGRRADVPQDERDTAGAQPQLDAGGVDDDLVPVLDRAEHRGEPDGREFAEFGLDERPDDPVVALDDGGDLAVPECRH